MGKKATDSVTKRKKCSHIKLQHSYFYNFCPRYKVSTHISGVALKQGHRLSGKHIRRNVYLVLTNVLMGITNAMVLVGRVAKNK